MTIANPTIPPVPVPAGVEHVSEWDDAAPTPYRILHGPNRGVEGHDLVVWTTAGQSADGCIDVDQEPPTIRIDILWERGLTSGQARGLAAVLIECADTIDPVVRRKRLIACTLSARHPALGWRADSPVECGRENESDRRRHQHDRHSH